MVGAVSVEPGDGAGDVVEDVVDAAVSEVSRVLFLGICLDFHYLLGRVGFPKL